MFTQSNNHHEKKLNTHDNQKNEINNNVSNAYEKNYDEQEEIETLEKNAPQFSNPVGQNVNKKALLFIGLAGISVLGLGLFAWQQLKEPEEQPQPVENITVTEPDLPLPSTPSFASSAASAPVQASQPHEVQTISAQSQPIEVQPVESRHRQPEKVEKIAIEQPVPAYPQQQPEPIITEEKPDPIEDMRKGNTQLVENTEASEGKTGGAEAVATAQVSAKYLQNRDKLLVQGTYLRCVLETKIVSDLSGFTSCVITEPVYSATGKYVLIPKGSKVLGQYSSSNPTSGRLGVIWDRIITPDGVDVTLKSPGVDNLGATGHVGKFQSHWGSRLSSALLISMISDVFKYAAAEYGPAGTTETNVSSTVTNPYESETANTLKQQAINQLERNNARPNTVTINQGSLINIYTAQDIDFSGVMN